MCLPSETEYRRKIAVLRGALKTAATAIRRFKRGQAVKADEVLKVIERARCETKPLELRRAIHLPKRSDGMPLLVFARNLPANRRLCNSEVQLERLRD
jgi:hypothetical protein